jgi:hypothetical protein
MFVWKQGSSDGRDVTLEEVKCCFEEARCVGEMN